MLRSSSKRLICPWVKVCNFTRLFSAVCNRWNDFSVPVSYGEICGKTWGNVKSKETVLCLHGHSDNCGSFDKLIPLLNDNKCYLSIDFPGHGSSSHLPMGWYAIEEYFASIKHVLAYYNLDSVDIIGHSMGGNVAGYFSTLFPEMVKKCVFLDSVGVYVDMKVHDRTSLMRKIVTEHFNYRIKKHGTPKLYSYAEAKKRLFDANPDLTEQARDILLKRGSKEVENNVFMFTRDPRLNLPSPHIIDVKLAISVFTKISCDSVIIAANEGRIANAKTEYPDRFGLLETLISQKSNISLMWVEGNHHFHLNNPTEDLITEINSFLD